MNHPYISPERPGEFDGIAPALTALIRYFREEKAYSIRLEQERVRLASESESPARDHMLEDLDRRLEESRHVKTKLLGDIARLAPGYKIALAWAVENFGFDEANGTVRFNKRRDSCFTFGMPSKPVIAVWVEKGKVVRSEPIDW